MTSKSAIFIALVATTWIGCSDDSPPGEMTNPTVPGTAGAGGMGGSAAAGTGATDPIGGAAAMSAAGSGAGSGASGRGGSSGAAAGSGGAAPMSAAGGQAPMGGNAAPDPSAAGAPSEPKWNDPGSMPWVPVPADKVAEECKLDKAMLEAQDRNFTSGWAVVRYGKMCHDGSGNDRPTEAYSATKTLGALVTGIASYETRMFTKSGPRTGQLLDSDLASHWLTSQSYNRQALVAHVLGMVAHNDDLSWGEKAYMYDTVGGVQINTLSTMVNAAISQDSARLGSGIQEFTRKFLFEPLGMTGSSWTGAVYAYTWSTTLHDMARVGVLMVHRGMWAGKRVLDEGWVYKMTHPAFEDANTGYGYLTWLNARTGSTGPGGAFGGTAADTCAPPALWTKYPHAFSNAPDCNYGMQSCEQKHDVGAWSAQGAMGQFIVGHPGLDLVIVAKNYANMGGPTGMWKAVRPALVAHDPMFKGDEEAFCMAYANSDYAPDIQAPIVAPPDPPSMM